VERLADQHNVRDKGTHLNGEKMALYHTPDNHMKHASLDGDETRPISLFESLLSVLAAPCAGVISNYDPAAVDSDCKFLDNSWNVIEPLCTIGVRLPPL
jgi:hypothetical protein